MAGALPRKTKSMVTEEDHWSSVAQSPIAAISAMAVAMALPVRIRVCYAQHQQILTRSFAAYSEKFPV